MRAYNSELPPYHIDRLQFDALQSSALIAAIFVNIFFLFSSFNDLFLSFANQSVSYSSMPFIHSFEIIYT